ncbi:MAG: ribosome maturation factor RimP [Clostridia bacterium]
MKIKLEDKIKEAILPSIIELGFEIEYIEFVKEMEQTVLRIVIDKPAGAVLIDDCENVSRSIEDIVDNLVESEYILEISSPGLQRELKNISLYKKYINNQIYVKLYKKNDYGKELTGDLIAVDEDNASIILKIEAEKIDINIKDIAVAHTTFDFDATFGKDNVNLNKLSKF